MTRADGLVWWMALVFVLAAALTQRGVARQDNGTAASTLDGVFTPAQATRGEETYMGICVACHPPGTYAGEAFKATWNERPLSELYDIIIQTMPKQDPGTLSAKEVAQVIAYILKENRMPAGSSELPSDTVILKKIRIELPR